VLVEPEYAEISIRRQCALLGVSRASWYYEPAGESQENLRLMRLIDEVYAGAVLRQPAHDGLAAGPRL